MTTRGADWMAEILADVEEPDATQRVVLESAAALLDEIELLEADLARDGVTVTGGNGQPAPHPALAQLRGHRTTFARIAETLGVGARPPGQSARSRQARRAADARWARVR